MKKLIPLLAAAFTLCGCSILSSTQTVTSTLIHPNGDREIKETKNRNWATGDSRQIVDKLKVTNGKTHGIGVIGGDQETSNTNAVAILQAVSSALTGVAGALK